MAAHKTQFNPYHAYEHSNERAQTNVGRLSMTSTMSMYYVCEGLAIGETAGLNKHLRLVCICVKSVSSLSLFDKLSVMRIQWIYITVLLLNNPVLDCPPVRLPFLFCLNILSVRACV